MTRPASRADRWLLAISVIIFVVTCLVAFRVLTSRSDTSETLPSDSTRQALSISSTVAANLTQFPQAPTLTGPLAASVDEIESLIQACSDYTEARRAQSEQHIAWLRDPATLSQEMIIALGSAPTAGLLRGLGTFALSDWGLKEKDAASCLVPIGKKINTLLVAEGVEPIEAFEEVEQ